MIYVVNGANRHLFIDPIRQMHVHRRQVLVERLGWDLRVVDGLEMDQFDTEDTIYLLLIDDNSWGIRSSLRLNPTLKPHLLSECFPHLCEGDIPRGEGVWEISRYCYSPNLRERAQKISALKEMYCGLLECALLYGWHQLTFVTELTFLSYSLRSGCDISPLGLPQTHGRQTIGAFAASITPAGLRAVREFAGVTGSKLRLIEGAEVNAA